MKRLLWMYMNDELVMSPSFPFQLKTYEETIMNVHERWISDESIFSIQTSITWKWDHMKRLLWMYMNDELVMSPSFPFQLKTYEETIMNVHERWISDESIFSIST